MEHIKPSSQKRNCLRWRPGESWSHVLKKLEVCYWIQRKNCDFYTEVEFAAPYSGRADVVALLESGPIVVEVLETEEILTQSKLHNYPPWELIQIKAKEQFTGLE